MALSRPVAGKITWTSTATGASTEVTMFDASTRASASQIITGCTQGITWKLQGSIGGSGVWADLTAATTGSTSGIVKTSTVGMVFDKVRVNVTANDFTSTSTGTATWWIIGN